VAAGRPRLRPITRGLKATVRRQRAGTAARVRRGGLSGKGGAASLGCHCQAERLAFSGSSCMAGRGRSLSTRLRMSSLRGWLAKARCRPGPQFVPGLTGCHSHAGAITTSPPLLRNALLRRSANPFNSTILASEPKRTTQTKQTGQHKYVLPLDGRNLSWRCRSVMLQSKRPSDHACCLLGSAGRRKELRLTGCMGRQRINKPPTCLMCLSLMGLWSGM
jgi:hypothetical protein